jgi:hypothetical protein
MIGFAKAKIFKEDFVEFVIVILTRVDKDLIGVFVEELDGGR